MIVVMKRKTICLLSVGRVHLLPPGSPKSHLISFALNAIVVANILLSLKRDVSNETHQLFGFINKQNANDLRVDKWLIKCRYTYISTYEMYTK